MDLSNTFADMLEYPLLDGSKFVDGTYTYSSDTGYPVITNSGGDTGGVVRSPGDYGSSNDLVVRTTADGRKILTPPDGALGDNASWGYYSMYQGSLTRDTFYRISFDLRLVNPAGVSSSRKVLFYSSNQLNLSVSSSSASLGGVALPNRIMSGDWVHIDIYVWNDGTVHKSLVIDGDLENASDLSYTFYGNMPNLCFAACALNSSDWPACPHVELGNPSIYILQRESVTPFVAGAALSVTQSGTESATLSAAVTYAGDPAAERTVSSAAWVKCTSAGAVDYAPDAATYTADEECDLLYTVYTSCKVLRSGATALISRATDPYANYAADLCGIHRVQPLEDFMQTSWSTGDSSRTITVTANGEYSVTVTNPGGSVTAAISITIPGLQSFDVFSGEPVPEGEWMPADRQSSAYRTGRATVQSQYSASPRILFLAEYYWSMLDPTESINLMLKKMIDPVTAEGAGLDAWGRIVGIKRALVPTVGEYLAFDPAGLDNALGDSFNNAPWNPLPASGMAPDAVYRIYVFVKAMLNIGNGSLADLNRYFSLLYENSGITVLHVGTMVLRVMDFGGRLTCADMLALKSLDWVPAGVGWQVWQGEPDCFGFLGSELQPFDQAPFISDSALIFE